jgi:hypothetical protein
MKKIFVSCITLVFLAIFSSLSFAEDVNLSDLVRLKITAGDVDVPWKAYGYGGASEAYISARFAKAVKLDDWDMEAISFILDPKFAYSRDKILPFTLKTPLPKSFDL